jgi:hypothetical protein
MIAKRIADARAALKRQGRRVGGALPLGYDAAFFLNNCIVRIEPAANLLFPSPFNICDHCISMRSTPCKRYLYCVFLFVSDDICHGFC